MDIARATVYCDSIDDLSSVIIKFAKNNKNDIIRFKNKGFSFVDGFQGIRYADATANIKLGNV